MIRFPLFPLLLLLLPPFASACFDADIENFMRQKEGVNWQNTSMRYYPGVSPKSYRELVSTAAEFLELSSNVLGVEVEFSCVSIKIEYDEKIREDSYAWPKYNQHGRPLHFRLTTKEFTRNFTQTIRNELNIAPAEWMDRVLVYVRPPNQEKERESVFVEITMKSTPRHPADPFMLKKDIGALVYQAYEATLDAQRRSTSAPSSTTLFSNLPPLTTSHSRTMSTSYLSNATVFISVLLIMSIVLIGLLVKSLIFNKKKADVVEMTNFAFLKNQQHA